MGNAAASDDPLARPAATDGLPRELGGLDDARRVASRVLRFLGRRWWVLLIVTGGLLYAVRAYANSLPRTYGCTPVVLELLQEPPSNAQSLESYDYGAVMLSYTVVPTQQAVLATGEVLDPVVAELGLASDPDYSRLAGRVATSAQEHTSLISLTVNGPRPETNAAVANAIARVYQKIRRTEREDRVDKMLAESERQVAKRRQDLKAAEEAIGKFRETHQVVDIGADVETIRQKSTNLFGMLKTAEADRDRVVEAEEQIRAAEKDKRDVGQVGAVREGTDVRGALAELRRREEQVESLALKLPEGSPNLVLARSQRDEQRRIANELALARAEDLKISAHNARRKAAALAAEHVAAEAEFKRMIGLRIAFEALDVADKRARRELTEALDENRSRDDLKARKSDPVRIRQWAQPSTAIVSPKLPVIYTGGGILAFVVALVIAFLLDLASTRLRGPDEINRLAGAPFLGTVPLFRSSKGESPGRRVLEEADGAASEAYRLIAATAFLHGGAGDAPKTLLITSPQAGEGKTTTALGLAMALSRRGARVLLVDADLRKPTVHSVLQTEIEPGLTTLFATGRSVWDAVRTVEIAVGDHEPARFGVLTAGLLPPNPADLLSGPRMHSFLREARDRYDVVVIDSPPVNPVSDACLLAPYVDGLVLVIREGRTHRGPFHRAVTRIRGVRGGLRGVVVNAVRSRRGAGYGYGYGADGYGQGGYGAPMRNGVVGVTGDSTGLVVANGAPARKPQSGRGVEELRASVRVLGAAQHVPRE
jgi:polysaccharide biosynthesis transport protein